MNLEEIKKEILETLPQHDAIDKWNISLSIRGSVSHNTFNPSNSSIDDIDLMGICVPPIEYYLGLKQFGSRGTLEMKEGKLDIVVFEWKKLISMLSGCNPNVICLLWTPEEMFIKTHPVWDKIFENRDLFLTKKIHHTFSNYAAGQLKRMSRFEFNGYMGEKRKSLVEEFGYDCYDEQSTEFLTSSGWKKFDEILEDSKIATYNLSKIGRASCRERV